MTTKIALSNIQDAVVTAITPAVPKITSIAVTNSSYTVLDDTAVGTAGGYIKITGTGFTSGSQVLVGTVAATSVSFVSGTELRAQLPATTAGTYVVYVVATDGSVAIRVNGITFSSTPTWSTASTLTAGSTNVPISIQLAATSDTTVTYAVASGSSLPAGLSLSSGGVLSGTITGISVDTTYNFTVNAIDAENQDSPRAFSITITVVLQVARSLRFNSADSANLTRTPATATNQKTWTWSGWIKRGKLGVDAWLFSSGINASNVTLIRFVSSNILRIYTYDVNTSTSQYFDTTAVFRDPSAWYHIVAVHDTTQATTSDRLKLYVNGVQQTGTTAGAVPQNSNGVVNSTSQHIFGPTGSYAGQEFDGYMTEVNFIDGQTLTPTSFGESDPDTGVWRPIRYTGTYGTNGFYLNFSDNSNTTAATLGKDYSGNNNNFTPTNFSVAAGAGNDSFVDSPTSYGVDTGVGGEVRGNYATLNPLAICNVGTATLSNGNLDISGSGGAFTGNVSTIAMSSSKWYAEYRVNTVGASGIGIINAANLAGAVAATSGYGQATDGYYRQGTAVYSNNLSAASGLSSYTDGDTLTIAVDIGAGKLWFGKNGTWESSGNPAAGTNATITFTPGGKSFYFLAQGYNTWSGSYNFGQRPFAYTAPTGFKALCTQNLPTPAIGATSTTQAGAYFSTVLYTGNGSTQSVSSVGFQPDLVWIKSRSAAYNHRLFDQVRGVQNVLQGNTTAAESSDGAGLTAFLSNGFTLGSTVNQNENNSTFAAWNWNAGGTTVTNTTGSISAQVRANPTAGFSIVTYTGTGANATVGHGLGVAPSMIIQKNRTGYDWRVYHVSAGNTNELYLNQTNVATTASTWNNTTPTSTVFSIGSGSGINGGGFACVAYCFAEVPGYSRIGSWVGNSSADGPFVYCGFRPAFVMLKIASGATANQWGMFDLRRSPYNVVQTELYPNLSNAEVSGNNRFDILSNGFKIRTSDTMFNNSGETHIFMAFAETPFKYARAR